MVAAYNRFLPVHPCACGERIVRIIRIAALFGSSPRVRGTRFSGSSPRVRGTPNVAKTGNAGFRFIPARAGNA